MRQKRNAWMGVVGGLGVVVAVAGFVGGWMAPRDTIVWALAVWILGATLVRVFTDPPGKS